MSRHIKLKHDLCLFSRQIMLHFARCKQKNNKSMNAQWITSHPQRNITHVILTADNSTEQDVTMFRLLGWKQIVLIPSESQTN